MCVTNTLKPFTAPSPVRTLQFTLFNKPSKKEIKPPNYPPSPKSFAIFTAATVTRHIKDVHHRNLRTPPPIAFPSCVSPTIKHTNLIRVWPFLFQTLFLSLNEKKKREACCYFCLRPGLFSVTVNESMNRQCWPCMALHLQPETVDISAAPHKPPELKFVIIFESFALITPGCPTSTVSAGPWTDTGLVCAFQMAPLEHA